MSYLSLSYPPLSASRVQQEAVLREFDRSNGAYQISRDALLSVLWGESADEAYAVNQQVNAILLAAPGRTPQQIADAIIDEPPSALPLGGNPTKSSFVPST